MNIVFITQTAVNPLSGGVQRVTYTLGNELEKLGHKVFFMAVYEKDMRASPDPRQLAFPYGGALKDSRDLEFFSGFIAQHDIHFIVNQVGIFPEINEFLRKVNRGNAKLINVHHNCVACLNARYREIVLGNNKNSRLWKYLDHPVVWRILSWLNRMKYGGFFKNSIRYADRLVLLSSKYIPELKHFGVRPDEKVTAIANPLSFTPVSHDYQKENRIIFIGRLRLTQKRIDKLLKIWKTLHDEFPDWEFDIVGDGEERKMMDTFVASHALNRIHFHGTTDPRPHLQRAKFLTSTSDFEGFPMVLVEAQVYGVVPVSYACFSAITDLIEDGKTGFIVPDFSTDSYINKMRSILMETSSEHLEAMRIAMRHKVLENAPGQIGQKWIQLFNELNAAK